MVKIKLTKVVVMLIVFVFVIVSVFFIINWFYNFIALDDTKLYDDNNKYINTSLTILDVDSNIKSSYKLKQKTNDILLGILSFINNFKKIFIVIFLAIILYMIFLDRETGIIPLMREMYRKRKF